MANDKKYWKGIAQLNNDPATVEKQQNEFAEYIPVEEFISDKATMESSNTNRRDFLKFLGFSTVAATLAACEAPVTKAIPYVNRQDDGIIPGVANWYASSYFDGNDYAGVLVKTREGRPIKIEGNDLCKVSLGGTNARIQASVLSLYDSARVKQPKAGKNDKTWKETDDAITAKLKQAKGIAILSSTIISDTTKAAIAEFANTYKNTRHVSYDAVSYSGMIQANLSSFGKAFIPTYHFDKADVIVSLGADFLANWISPMEHARQYAMGRKVGADKKTMSKHYQFEAILSLTGSNADERFPTKASELGKVALGILAGVGGSVSAPNTMAKEVAKVADALKKANGKALVVSGSNDASVQLVVNAINEKIGAYGSTINTDVVDYTHQGDDAALKKLVDDINGNAVDTVIFYNTNPIYTAPKGLGFEAAMKKLATRISFSGIMDETTVMCDFVCPDHHYLESWNDHKPRTGHYAIQQPTIRPLYNTRHAQESLLTWANWENKSYTANYHSYLQNYWKNNMFGMQNAYGDFTAFWNKSVQDGAVELHGVAAAPAPADAKPAAKPAADTATAAAVPAMTMAADGAFSFTGEKITLDTAASNINGEKGGNYELVIYQSTAMGNGNQSQNPWLQEMPDPITKITWDNYITMHPADVKTMNLFGVKDEYGKDVIVQFDQLEDQLSMVNLTANGHTVKLPVWFQPGQAKGTIGVAIGYGRKGFNEIIDNTGANIYPAIGMTKAGNMSYDVFSGVTMADAGEKHDIACTQTHSTIMGRSEDILRETNLAVYASGKQEEFNPRAVLHTYKGEADVEQVNLWNDFDRPDHQWALAIDLNSCIGCGACIVSCNAENNIPVVGKHEVRRSREMHWMRIDRYYSSETVKEEVETKGEMGTKEMYRLMENPSFDNPKVAFQPVMCQHCNHAPCETVCPVLATNHSSEGLNQMAYNRCVGTRYCANNCPYKVRRFNWFNYVEYHRFDNINLNPATDVMGRMVLNPDVVVRSRGVMEKCSMCVQRIQAGKLEAKKASRRLTDGEIKMACTQSCPTNAIIFGDLNDANSEVSKWFNSDRKFEMLEEVGVRPSVFYLTKVWNRESETAHV